MIQEGQRMIRGSGSEPQRNTGQFDRKRVEIHAINAVRRDKLPTRR